MKLPLLLSQYLRDHQKLRLPGLGTLYSSGSVVVGDGETAIVPSNIRFEYGTVKEPDDDLIDFIKQKTGKIKPLAIADLDCFIENGLQMLNIGKPFYIEGIGTIQKAKGGGYEFLQRDPGSIRVEESGNERTESSEKRRSVFEDEKYSPSVNPWQKVIVAALILGGLAIVVLGGYYLYNQNNSEARVQDTIIPTVDSSNIKKDTLVIPADTARSQMTYATSTPQVTSPGEFKFILETTNSKKRALRRFSQLKSYFLPIKMETSDSIAFKLYFLLPATPADTARIRDSLSRYYVSKVRVEQ
ncbi:MAG TPA: hypothetical protein VGD17_09500 [Chitinophagaceae bacterium]